MAGQIIEGKLGLWPRPIKTEEIMDQIETSAHNWENETDVDCANCKEEIKAENYFLEEDNLHVFNECRNVKLDKKNLCDEPQEDSNQESADHTKKIEYDGLKIHFNSDVKKIDSFMAADVSYDAFNKNHFPIKHGTSYMYDNEIGRHLHYKNNFELKVANLFYGRLCRVSLSKLSLEDLRCGKCCNYFCSLAAKNRHFCVTIKIKLTNSTNKNEINNSVKRFHGLQCNVSFNSKGRLNSHIFSVHKKIKDKKCSQCDSKFSYNHEVKDHILCVHIKNKIHKCHKCPASYCLKRHLKKHNKRVHEKIETTSSSSKLLRCPKCSTKFRNTYDLFRHDSSVHLKIKPYRCADCSKRFCRKTVLKKHVISVHQNLRNYSCSECSSTFTRKDCLTKHIKIQHTINNCSQCDSKFCHDRDKKRPNHCHVDVPEKATLPKSYQCSKCQSSFFNWNALQLHHSSTHFSLQDYQCDKCSKRFTRKHSLNKHFVEMHLAIKNIYSCSECTSTFTRKDTLNNHYIIKHNLKKCNQCKK